VNSSVYTQHFSAQLYHYILGILLIPLLGIGVWLIWRTYRRQMAHCYELNDEQIIDYGDRLTRKIDLENIESINLMTGKQSRLFDAGSIIILTPASELEIEWIPEPEKVLKDIQERIAARLEALKPRRNSSSVQDNYDPGSLDRMDYLTGLWQQGLIDDEEYNKERKHFES
jgi:ABC-type nickel/cobalt efflux system permease component RcnA